MGHNSGARPNSWSAPEAVGVDTQSSNYGNPVGVVYGTNKTTGNCIWYGDFQARQTSGGGSGGGKGGAGNQYNYTSSFMLVMCEGPIAGFNDAWQGSSFQPLSHLDPAFTALGNLGQSPWSHFGGTQALGYSGWALVAWLDYNLGSTASTPNYQIEVQGFNYSDSATGDANPSNILTDICTNAIHGINFPYLGNLTQYSNYCVANGLYISPVYNTESTGNSVLSDLFSWTNTQAYYSEGVLKVVPYGDVSVTGNGVTYTPDLTVQANFTDSDYIVQGNNPPVTMTRKALPDTSNTVRIQYSDRSYYYYDEIAEARDEEDSITNGVRALTTKRINAITQASVARFVAQNILQRNLYIRNTYEWSTSFRYALLEPSDIATLTDTTLGITQALVRITKTEEDADGMIRFTAEELPIGVGHSANYNTQANGGYILNINVDPGAVVTPAFVRGPGFIVPQNSPEIWIAIAGGSPNWGGAQVFVSYDNTNWNYSTTWLSQARYGLIGSAGLPAGSDPDTTHTLNVTLEYGELLSVPKAAADALQTLCLVDNELISFETAALVSGEQYNLTYLRRGAYGTANVTHSAGATFIRLDDAILRMPIDPSYVGQTIYLKFLSFNIFGKTPRTLANETSYSYVVGTNEGLPDQPAVPGSFVAQTAPDGAFLNWSNSNPAAVAVTSIERSPDQSTWTVIAQVGNAHTSYHDIWSVADQNTSGKVYYYRARALGSLPQAGFSAYTATVSGSSKTTVGTGNLPNVIGTTANFNVTAAGWYEIALSDNSAYADYRCGFTCTVTVETGASQGTCNFQVTNDSTGTKVGLTQLQGAPEAPITQARVRADGSNHTALDVYVNWTSGTITISVAVAPITGAGNGASAQAGLAATAGTIEQTLPLDPAGTGSNGGGFGHVGPGSKWHLLLDSGDVYHGGAHAFDNSLNFVPGQGNVPDSSGAKMFRYGTYANMPAAGTAGRIYHAYDKGDNGITYRDTGSAWTQMAVGHLADINGTTDNLAAGTNTNVVNQTNLTSGNVDLGKSGVANRILDNINDTATFSRTLTKAQTGNVPNWPGFGKNSVSNGAFSQNLSNTPFATQLANGATVSDGWFLSLSAVHTCEYENGVSTGTPADVLLRLTPSSTLAASTSYSSYITSRTAIPVVGGSTYNLQVTQSTANNATLPSGVTVTHRTYFAVYDGNGNLLSAPVLDATGQNVGYETTSLQGTLASNASYLVVNMQAIVDNTNTTSVILGTGLYADMRWYNVQLTFDDPIYPNGVKAYIDANDTTAGGHVGLTSYSSGIAITSAIQAGTGLTDGGTVTFSAPLASTPVVVFGDGGVTYDSGLTGSQYQSFIPTFTYSGGNCTGFTAALKINSLAGASTNQSVNFSSNSATLTVPAGSTIVNGALTVNASLSDPGGEPVTVTVTDTSTGKTLFQKNYFKTQSLSIGCTDASAVNGTVITISCSGATVTGSTITYKTATAPTSHSATPSGVPGINWTAFATS